MSLICTLWPTEQYYMEVLNTLRFIDTVKKPEQVLSKSEYQGEMSTNQEKIMQDISRENVEMKFKIDSFKREHQQRLNELRQKLGIDI